MDLKKIAFIVDGPTEEGSLRDKFKMTHYCEPEIRLNPGNSENYKIEGFVNSVSPIILSLLKTKVRTVFFIPDFEKRKGCVKKFNSELKKALIKHINSISDFTTEYLTKHLYVISPNIMFENWIVSDILSVKTKNSEIFIEDVSQENFEGVNGTSILQRKMVVPYKKTIHGRKFFKLCNDSISMKNSESFYEFYTTVINEIEKHCK